MLALANSSYGQNQGQIRQAALFILIAAIGPERRCERAVIAKRGKPPWRPVPFAQGLNLLPLDCFAEFSPEGDPLNDGAP
jgi:hypothetical protein